FVAGAPPGCKFENDSSARVRCSELVDVTVSAELLPAPSAADIQRARGNLVWVVGSLVVFAGWVALAHAVPATNAHQPKVKSLLALVAVTGALACCTCGRPKAVVVRFCSPPIAGPPASKGGVVQGFRGTALPGAAMAVRGRGRRSGAFGAGSDSRADRGRPGAAGGDRHELG